MKLFSKLFFLGVNVDVLCCRLGLGFLSVFATYSANKYK